MWVSLGRHLRTFRIIVHSIDSTSAISLEPFLLPSWVLEIEDVMLQLLVRFCVVLHSLVEGGNAYGDRCTTPNHSKHEQVDPRHFHAGCSSAMHCANWFLRCLVSMARKTVRFVWVRYELERFVSHSLNEFHICDRNSYVSCTRV